jgi:iron(III) transport system permease protein
MILVPIVTVVLSFAFSWVVLRSRVPGRATFDFIAFLPHAVPSILFGVGALLIALFAIDKALHVYGTIWILLIVFTVARLSYGTRMTNAVLIQISRELDESAEVSGAGTWGVVTRILAPLMAPALLYAALWIALLVYRELTLAILLTTSGNFTLPVLIWNQFSSGQQGRAAALSLLMLLVMTPLIGAFLALARRRGLIASG